MAMADGTYRLGPESGELLLKTSRSGMGRRAGHDLVIEVTGWEGEVTLAGGEPDTATVSVRVEVDSLEQLDEVLGEDVELVLLDNFPVWQTQIAVKRRDARAPATKLESSGGLSLDTAAEYAGTGVDYLAVGALTHSVRVLDIGLDV